MKFSCLIKWSLLLIPLVAIIAIEFNCFKSSAPVRRPPIKEWQSISPLKAEVNIIRPCKISVPESMLKDFKQRLKNARIISATEGTHFQNGFSVAYMRSLLQHWTQNYDWRKWEKVINSFPQYFARVQGLDIHFIHIKSQSKSPDAVTVPLMLIHGWPGSFFEFHRTIPLLLEKAAEANIDLELVIPSLPGYAWSSAPATDVYPGCGPDCAGVLFTDLMTNVLNHSKFFVQGGDWGSFVAQSMAIHRPDAVFAMHVNMFAAPLNDLRHWLRMLAASWLPSGWILSEREEQEMLPFNSKLLNLLDVSGYFHLQATRPDTPGFALNDSPMGLAAYILEKFSGFSMPMETHKSAVDGGLEALYPGRIDELLTNVMIYWFTGSIASSMRFYKNTFQENSEYDTEKQFHNVLLGVANYPNELGHYPESWVRKFYPNLVHYSNQPKGGHFAAFEVPEAFSEDLLTFVKTVLPQWREEQQKQAQQQQTAAASESFEKPAAEPPKDDL